VSAEGRRSIYACGELEIDLERRELRSSNKPVPLESRAFEVFEALVRSAGDLLTKDDLMGRVWPGMSVEENTLQVHIYAIRKALGRHRGMLRTSLGRGYRLLGDWTVKSSGTQDNGAAIDESLKVPPSPSGNLLFLNSELIGRAAALQELRDLLSAYRLVTLTGPGGIGKTRLTIDAARDLLQRRRQATHCSHGNDDGVR
jgi:DNA-binding winged helix-turn-helix (wHTH) protein